LSDLYCIQNKSTYVGNSVLFWRVDGSGYTCNLDEAWKVTKEKADEICRSRPKQDYPLPLALLESIAERHVDMQKLPPAEAGGKA